MWGGHVLPRGVSCRGYIPSARLDPASTNREWVEQIARQEGITDSFGFSIYLDRFGTLTSLHGSGGQGNHIMDAISKIDAKSRKTDPTKKFVNIEKQLSFRKEFFAKDHDSMKDPVATAKIFHQIQAGIKSGLYKPKSDAKYNEMCAQFYYVDNGDDMEQSYLEAGLKNWLPAAAQSDKRIAEVEKIHAKAEYVRCAAVPLCRPRRRRRRASQRPRPRCVPRPLVCTAPHVVACGSLPCPDMAGQNAVNSSTTMCATTRRDFVSPPASRAKAGTPHRSKGCSSRSQSRNGARSTRSLRMGPFS